MPPFPLFHRTSLPVSWHSSGGNARKCWMKRSDQGRQPEPRPGTDDYVISGPVSCGDGGITVVPGRGRGNFALNFDGTGYVQLGHQELGRTRTSTSFWTTSHAHLNPAPTLTRRAPCSTWWPCRLNADWCLRSDVMTNSRPQGRARSRFASGLSSAASPTTPPTSSTLATPRLTTSGSAR